MKIDAQGVNEIRFGSEYLDLHDVEQLVDPSQTRAAGFAIHLAAKRFMDGDTTLATVLDQLDAFFDAEGLDPLDPFHRPGCHPGRYARPRRLWCRIGATA